MDEAIHTGIRKQALRLVLCEGVAVFGDILASAILLREGRSLRFERVGSITAAAQRSCSGG